MCTGDCTKYVIELIHKWLRREKIAPKLSGVCIRGCIGASRCIPESTNALGNASEMSGGAPEKPLDEWSNDRLNGSRHGRGTRFL